MQFLTTCEPADADSVDFVSPLCDADEVWFSGGDQCVLGKLFVRCDRNTRFETELLGVLRRGGVVGGTSAGAAVMSEVMTTAGEPQNGRPAEPKVARGFGLLRNVIAEQHFEGAGRGGRVERFTRLLLNNELLRSCVGENGPTPEEMVGLAVEEQTALILSGNHLRVFGRQKAHVFLKSSDQKSVTWHALEAGDAAFLYLTPDGPKLELDSWQAR